MNIPKYLPSKPGQNTVQSFCKENLKYQFLFLIDMNLFINTAIFYIREIIPDCSQIRRNHSKEKLTSPLTIGARVSYPISDCILGTSWMSGLAE